MNSSNNRGHSEEKTKEIDFEKVRKERVASLLNTQIKFFLPN